MLCWYPAPSPPYSPLSCHVPLCQCIDPTCILWSKLAFDIYAGCQADRETASEDFTMPLLSPAPLDTIVISRAEEEQDRPFVLVIVTCVFVFLFVFLISLLRLLFCRQTLLGKTIDTRSVGRMGRLGGLGFGSSGLGLNLFGPSSWPLKLFSRVRQMHPGGRFHFVICVFDILLKCC